ncbi:acyl-CoA dehydrogenase [Nocardia sp. CA2R105]|uniref:acyl-CoA dehydrogenase family protein n=1 Tax=Nocardia coffeae TaxID=2873381 RepID=UPI001CA73493|nr:acyl-CoA dehydrogenase family protein [Nocardia coffeae]MBY8862291.1 acyl-CoA dehydrogenase [Nocardia coffeae]
MDGPELELLAATLRMTMSSTSGNDLDRALTNLGWLDMLIELPETAVPLVFRLLGETGAHAPLLNDVIRHSAGEPLGDGTVVPLPFSGGSWVIWERDSETIAATEFSTVDRELPLRRVDEGREAPLAAGRRALSWWLIGTGRAMLALARQHALDRQQFGRSLASFQAVRHRLAETLVALEGAEATLYTAEDELGALLAKAASGQAALTAARHCQQVLGGIGFTDEHNLHRHIRRTLVLDGLLGSARELTQQAGALIRAQRSAPRLAPL